MGKNFLIGRFTACVVVAVVSLMTFFGTTTASGQGLSDVTQGSTVLLSGGTNNPDAIGMEYKLGGQLTVGADEIVKVHTPQQFGPLYGDMSYDESRQVGGDNMRTAILEAQAKGDDVVAVGYSQSASENGEEFAQMAGEGLSLDNVTAIYIASPRTPGSGIETRGISLPGATAMGPAANVVKAYYVCWVQDPVGNAPAADRLSDPLVVLNALLGYRDYHGRYDNVDITTARSYERDGVMYFALDDGKIPVIEEMHRGGIFLPEATEAQIKDRVKVGDPGPGPVGSPVEQAPVADSAPAVSAAAELPLVTPAAATPDVVTTAQEWLPDLAQAGQEFIETVTQPEWTPTPDVYTPAVPSQMVEQANVAIDNGAAAVKNDVILQQVIPAPVIDQAANDLHNFVGQFVH